MSLNFPLHHLPVLYYKANRIRMYAEAAGAHEYLLNVNHCASVTYYRDVNLFALVRPGFLTAIKSRPVL